MGPGSSSRIKRWTAATSAEALGTPRGSSGTRAGAHEQAKTTKVSKARADDVRRMVAVRACQNVRQLQVSSCPCFRIGTLAGQPMPGIDSQRRSPRDHGT